MGHPVLRTCPCIDFLTLCLINMPAMTSEIRFLLYITFFSEGYGGFVDLGLGGQATSNRINKGSWESINQKNDLSLIMNGPRMKWHSICAYKKNKCLTFMLQYHIFFFPTMSSAIEPQFPNQGDLSKGIVHSVL